MRLPRITLLPFRRKAFPDPGYAITWPQYRLVERAPVPRHRSRHAA